MFRHFVVPPNGSVVQGILPKIMTPQSRLKNSPKVQLFFEVYDSGAVDIQKSIHEITSLGKHNKETYQKKVSSKLSCTLVFILADGVSKVGAFGTKPFWVLWLVQLHDVWSPSPVMRLPPGKDPWIIMNYHDSSTCSICTGGIRGVEVPVGKLRSFLPWGFEVLFWFHSILIWGLWISFVMIPADRNLKEVSRCHLYSDVKWRHPKR